MTAASSIDYDALTQEALRGVVRKVLSQVVARGGLPGDHHFYIAFNTQADGVVLSRRLKEKYPDEMMIVLQHRYWDLAVTEEGFEVKLTFDGIPERLYVPFDALRVFFDPSVRFTLQFGEASADEGQDGRRRGERKTKPRPASRPGASLVESDATETSTPADVKPAQPVGPSPVVPLPGPAAPTPMVPAASSSRPIAVPSQPAPAAEQPVKQGGGAKVFSLDQFRNKK
jgi:hypothetical protein